MTDTIYALSSGALPAGIAVVRVSGPRANAALARLVARPPSPRRAALRTLRDDGGVIDRALVLVFPAPHSSTGEDVVEFHLHGGVAVVAALYAALEDGGARLAHAGEFTRRAFDNHRLDLTQVEGLADLVAAETEAQRRAALAQAGGALRSAVEDWQARLVALLADIEAELDFSDSDEVVGSDPSGAIAALVDEIDTALSRAAAGRGLRDGLKIVVSGPPNVGKSSLVNVLAQREVAIVSPIAGTTRDAIEVRLDLGGVLVTLVDTAGLRDGADAVEAEGVARAHAHIASADLVLALHDGSAPPGEGMPVRTKLDLAETSPDGHAVSSLTGAGIGELLAWLGAWAAAAVRPDEPAMLTQARHVAACRSARDELCEAVDQPDIVLRAENIRLARRALGALVGTVDVETILDAIFARFCIGK